jgi:DNA-binding winged helix-turn-helix (wHTH) protein/Tol biopolymer transport system component
MSGNQQVPTVISFGPFEANLHTQELRKHGVRLRLPGQSFQILEMLLKRPGELVTREELQQALWPSDTHVDFERGVNAAVNRLRDVMGDSADTPHLIETLPRRGYRFIGSIDVPPKPDPGPVKFMAWILAAAAVVCLLVLGFFYSKTRHTTKVEENIQPVPLTAYPGFESFPAFSPDGSQVVFSWSGDPESGPMGMDLYVKVIGTENLLRLTHQSESLYPAWSPDGAQIAFSRESGKETGVYVLPALGGPERKLISAHDPVAIRGPVHWSPDSKWITYTKYPAKDGHFLYLLSVEHWRASRSRMAKTVCMQAAPFSLILAVSWPIFVSSRSRTTNSAFTPFGHPAARQRWSPGLGPAGVTSTGSHGQPTTRD